LLLIRVLVLFIVDGSSLKNFVYVDGMIAFMVLTAAWSGEGSSVPTFLESAARSWQAARPAWPSLPQALLANGDRIAGGLIRGDDRRIVLTRGNNEWTVPISALNVLWLVEPVAESSAFAEDYPWLKAGRKSDVLLLANGDVLTGDIEAFSDIGHLKIKCEGTSRVINKERIRAIAFNPALAKRMTVKGESFIVTLRDGSRITTTAIKSTGDDVLLNPAFNTAAELKLPLKIIAAIDRVNANDQWIDDVKPMKDDVQPYLKTAWPWTVRRSVKNHPLTLQTTGGVDTFDRGLGLHPRTALTYQLKGEHTAFTATAGMDAVTGRRGAAEVRILVDDVVKLRERVTALKTLAIDVPLAGAKSLAIVVDFTTEGDAQADVNLVNAVLTRR
jgi:hypothetical protein